MYACILPRHWGLVVVAHNQHESMANAAVGFTELEPDVVLAQNTALTLNETVC